MNTKNNENYLKKQFKSSIMRGTGEAYLLMKKYPEVDFSREIKLASLKNHAYDPQYEGDRSNYLFRLICQSSGKEKIKKAILSKLVEEKSDTWVLEQLFQLAALFAKNDDGIAKRAIYARLHHNIIAGSDWCGERAVISLDGFQGLKYIVQSRGKLLQNNLEAWENESLISFFQREYPSMDVCDELRKAAESNPFIKSYVEAVMENKKLRMEEKGKRSTFDYKFISENIKMNRFLVPESRYNEISVEDIKVLANDFLIEANRSIQEKYLRIFAKVPFPYGYEYILKLSKKKYSAKDRLIEFAVKALSFFKNNEIRDFVLQQMVKSKYPYLYTDLLITNYKNGDGELLSYLLHKTRSMGAIHGLAESFIKIYQANSSDECKTVLVDAYGRLNCARCRKDIIEILIKHHVLPSKILRELQFDCCVKIQQLYSSNEMLIAD